MAWDPCVSCGKPFHGPALFNYVTWYDGEERKSFRYRQCGSCSAELRNDASGRADRRGDDGKWQFVDQVAQARLEAVQ